MSTEPPGELVDTPPPASPPRYDHLPGKQSRVRTWTVKDAIDGGFFVLGTLLLLWFGWLLLTRGLRLSWTAIVVLVVFWLLVAYIGLPRLQEVLARIYVPDYFIGRALTTIGVLGDPINVALLGSAEQIHDAMTKAGWTRADDVTLRSSWGIIVSSVFRRPYPAAPVSPLLLFNHQQAFAYEQEVDGNASQRHHIRFWPTPSGWLLPGGFAVDWLAGGSYDRAVGLSAFTLQVTHKIDADVDIERDYVVGTVRYACPDARLRIIRDFSTAFRSRNGGGDIVHTDGNLPVLDLRALDADAPVGDRPSPLSSTASSSAVSSSHPSADALLARRLPPPALPLAGTFSVVKALIVGLGLVSVLLGADRSNTFGHDSTTTVVTSGVTSVLVVVGWLLVLWRQAWARTLVMALCTVAAAGQLASLDDAGRASVLELASAGLSVLVLIAVSSGAARRWVEHRAPRRTDRTDFPSA